LIGKKKADEATKKSSKKKSGGVTVAEASKASLTARHIQNALKKGDVDKANKLESSLSSKQRKLVTNNLLKLRKKAENADNLKLAKKLDDVIKQKGETLQQVQNIKNINDQTAQRILDNIKPGSDYKAQQYFNYGGLKFADQEGAFQIPGSQFAGWKTQAEGVKALYNQARKDQERNLNVRNFVTKYAPPQENDTEKYIRDLCDALGVNENTNISTINEDKLISFIAKKESGTEIKISDYGGGSGTVALGKMLDSYAGGYDNVNQSSGYDDVVGYKSGGNYYSINTYTGEKVKVDKASYKSLAKIDKKDYENIKTSLDTTMAKSSKKGDALNRDQLAALKAVRPDLAGKNSKQLLDWWKKRGLKEDPSLLQKVNDYTLKTGGSIGGGEGGSSIDTTPSYDLKNDPNYKALPDDLKKVATYFETVGLSSNTEQGTRLIQSLQTAADQSNAYYKQFFNIAADTMIRTNDEYQQAFGSKSDRLNKQITQINEDLAKNKEFMTLEEQSDLTRLANEYKANLQTTQGTMAAAGLTQSTIRSEAEQRLAAQNKGLVEDTQRQYGKRIADLETAAARGNQEAQADLADLKAKLGYNITQLGRDIETQVGSASMPALSGYTPLGNITGSLVENRTKDIAQRAGGLLGDFNLESLNLTL